MAIQRRDCLSLYQQQVLMVHRADLNGGRHPISSDDVLVLNASYVSRSTNRVLRNVTIRLRGPISLELVASSRNAHWFYLVQYVARLQKHICTCSENREQDFCKHVPEQILTELV